TVRVVLRVKTNRAFDDRVPSANGVGWNSTTGAIVVDNLHVVSGTSDVTNDFETSTQIRPRFTWTDLGGGTGSTSENLPTNSWICTARAPSWYGHIHNLGDLDFQDPCGKLFCNLSENILVQSDHDDGHRFHKESQNWAYSPTICINSGIARGIAQGTPAGLRTAASASDLQFDFYSGFDDTKAAGTLMW